MTSPLRDGDQPGHLRRHLGEHVVRRGGDGDALDEFIEETERLILTMRCPSPLRAVSRR